MLPPDDFIRLAKTVLGIDLDQRELAKTQARAILAASSENLFLVAGPGTGKTTSIALRVLKLLFVDGVGPESVLATTFTRKAATELSSRILGWGDRIRREALQRKLGDGKALKRLDFSRLRVGTLDSLAEQLLTEFRPPSAAAPALVEDFARRALMLRAGLFDGGRLRSKSLETFISQFRGRGQMNVGTKVVFLTGFRDRLANYRVDVDQFRAIADRNSSRDNYRGAVRAIDATLAFQQRLAEQDLLDFIGLELRFLEGSKGEPLADFLRQLRFVFVDEYQDTNPLQETIYLELARTALANGGSICVVGDDDQALYRFRGATVELFNYFESRFRPVLRRRAPQRIFLNQNYRSTKAIVEFVNAFIQLDASYGRARVKDKPPLVVARRNVDQNVPVLGMFRPNVSDLADSIAAFVDQLVNRGGVTIRSRKQSWSLELDAGGGPNDIALLSSTVRETGNNGRRLPGLLRDSLGRLASPIQVFNPRGQALTAVPEVRRLLGLMLECLDPGAKIQSSIGWIQSLAAELDAWRGLARDFVKASRNSELKNFLQQWAARRPYGRRLAEIERVSLNDLLYKLLAWMPAFLEDVERITQLEAVSRTIAEAAVFSSFGGEVIFKPNARADELSVASVRAALQDIFAALASGAIDLNEDLLETLPRNRLSVMTVHQAKGLEFPLVIMDVGSDFRDRRSRPFRRFPTEGGETHLLEDALAPYASAPPSRRDARDRAFDDLIRQHFVAFSRPQDVLLLVGLSSVKDGYTVSSGDRVIENVGTGWSRDSVWRWGRGLPNLVHI